MRKFFYLWTMVLGIALVSCSKDDDAGNGDKAVLAGAWDITKLVIESESTYTEEGVDYTVNYNGEGTQYDAQVVFHENPNEISSSGSITVLVKAFLNGVPFGEEEMVLNLDENIESGTWEVTGDELIIQPENPTESEVVFIIKQLTNNKLVLKYEEYYEEDEVTTLVNIRYEFSR